MACRRMKVAVAVLLLNVCVSAQSLKDLQLLPSDQVVHLLVSLDYYYRYDYITMFYSL